MGLSMEELREKAARTEHRIRSSLKERYDLAKRLGFSSYEAVVLQSHTRETILKLAVERGLITDITDPNGEH